MNDILNKDFLGLERLNEYLKTNYIVLQTNKHYRVSSLTFGQKEEMVEFLCKIKSKLISDKTVRTEKELIESWTEKGIDIERMTKNFQRLERLYWKKMYELGALVTNDGRKDLVEELEKELAKIREKQKEISFKKTDLLSTSYECQYITNLYKYASYLSLQTDVEGEWKRAYDTYEQYLQEVDGEIATEALTLIALVDSHARFNS